MLLRTLHVLKSLCPFSMFGPQMHRHHLAILKLITADPILSKERIAVVHKAGRLDCVPKGTQKRDSGKTTMLLGSGPNRIEEPEKNRSSVMKCEKWD